MNNSVITIDTGSAGRESPGGEPEGAARSIYAVHHGRIRQNKRAAREFLCDDIRVSCLLHLLKKNNTDLANVVLLIHLYKTIDIESSRGIVINQLSELYYCICYIERQWRWSSRKTFAWDSRAHAWSGAQDQEALDLHTRLQGREYGYQSSRTSRMLLGLTINWWLQPRAACSYTMSGIIWRHRNKIISTLHYSSNKSSI